MNTEISRTIGHSQYCTFYIDGSLFGVPIAHTRGILQHQGVIEVPLAPRDVAGLINFRGNFLAAVDLRERLGLSPRSPSQHSMHVIVSTGQGDLGILVDTIGEIVDLDPSDMQPPLKTLEGSADDLVYGVFEFDNERLLILDTALATDPAILIGA